MSSQLAGVTDTILRLHGFAALAIVFLIPALEASAFVGFVFPGEIAVLLGGVLAYQGRAPLWAVIVAAVLGAAIGDSIGYAVGKRWGRSLLHGTLGRLPIIRPGLDKHLDQAQEYVRRRGPRAVFVGRFTAALRVLVPGLAGMAGVPYRSFVTFNVLGAIIWGTGFALLGFFAGAAWRRVAGIAGWAGLGLLFLILLGLIGARFARPARERGDSVADSLAALPPARWFRLGFPAPASLLAGRVDPARATGFSLSVWVMGGVIATWLFGGMLQDVVAREEAVRFDPSVLRWFVEHRVHWLTGFMKGAMWLGSNAVVIPVALIVAAVFVVRRRSYRPLVQLAAAVVSSIVLYDVVKAVVHRARPPVAARLVHVSGFSFPSGHATVAVAVWGAIALVVASGRRSRMKVLLGAAAGMISLVVAVSRLYLGVHWFTDVVGGCALGAAILSCIAALCLILGPGRGRSRTEIPARSDGSVGGVPVPTRPP
ncbi:MAG TPA: bifunctional DedA family/phosphatase PAP2 family protein [Actinomycetota bacterium]|nr:bifunctional DedA family/phosphatase PAP2 family protein [Actinomycetota bacterium]